MKGVRRDWAVKITISASRVLLAPSFCLKTEGIENLPRKQAVILLPKHQRWEDIPLISIAASRPLYYVAKQELFRNPISRRFLKSVGGLPLDRKSPMKSRESLYDMIELLKSGEGVVIFPEGTYYRDKMGPGQLGMIRMVLSRLDIPFIPVGIRYTKNRWRTNVKIKFGSALRMDSGGVVGEFTRLIMDEIARLSGFSSQLTGNR